MKAVLFRIFKSVGSWPTALGAYRRATKQSLVGWFVLALLNWAVQIVFRRNLVPGEFATLNTVLGAMGLVVVPIFALRQALDYFQPREAGPAGREIFQEARVPLQQNFILAWSFVCALLFLPALGFLSLPRFLVSLLALPNVLVILGAAYCATVYEQRNKLGFWIFLLCVAGTVRLLVAWTLTEWQPSAESGLVAGFVGGLFLLSPLLRQARMIFAWAKARAPLRERDFCLYLAATLSVTLGIFLFTSADRILAQAWFGRASDNNLGLVRWGLFDGYQTAGLLGRGLLWGTQPILAVLLARRAGQDRTVGATRNLFWLYLGVLIIGSTLLCLLAQPLARIFGGNDVEATAYFIPGFAVAMLPLGFLQGFGILALASRRYPECFTFGLSALAYTLFLALEGKPQLMLSCMFGGGGVAIMLVLFIAVVRWGRLQP